MQHDSRFQSTIDIFAGDDQQAAQAFAEAFATFDLLARSRVMVSPAPGYKALFKTWRAAAALTETNRLLSTEMFHISDVTLFSTSEDERLANIGEVRWEGHGDFISPAPPREMTVMKASLLDFDGRAISSTLAAQLDHLQALLASHLQPFECFSLLMDVPSSAKDVPVAGGARLKPGARRRLETVLSERIVEEYVQAMTAFRTHLDPTITEILDLSHAGKVQDYNWLAGLTYGKQDAVLSHRRQQAARAFPLLWPQMVAPVGAIAEAVTRSTPLKEAITGSLNVPARAIKIISGLSLREMGYTHSLLAYEAHAVLDAASKLPQNGVPASPMDWQGYMAYLRFSDRVAELGQEPALSQDLLLRAKGLWCVHDVEEVDRSTNHLRDILVDIHKGLIKPVANTLGMPWRYHNSMALILGGRGPNEVIKGILTWEEVAPGIKEQLQAEFPAKRSSDTLEWESLIDRKDNRYRTQNGASVTFLTTQAELIAEGKAMQHCVGSYAGSCYTSPAHIASIRDADGTRLATVEIRENDFLNAYLEKGELPVRGMRDNPVGVVQMRGLKNATAHDDAYRALWEFTGALASGVIKVKRQELRDALELRRLATVNKTEDTYYNPLLPGAWEAAWKALNFIMPKSVVKNGLETTLKNYQLKENGDVVTPSRPQDINENGPAVIRPGQG